MAFWDWETLVEFLYDFMWYFWVSIFFKGEGCWGITLYNVNKMISILLIIINDNLAPIYPSFWYALLFPLMSRSGIPNLQDLIPDDLR